MIAQVDRRYLAMRPYAAWRRILTRTLFEGRPVTTRGRWFNRVVLGHFELEKRVPSIRHVRKPIFIVGIGRSGSTILCTILSMHKHLGALNEPKALWYIVNPADDISGHYSSGSAQFRMDASDATPTVQRIAHRLYGAYLTVTFTQRVLDKNPEIVFRIPFVRAIFPDAKFIFLVRNGWNTCSSIAKWSQREGNIINGEVHDWWGVNGRKWRLMVEQLVEIDSTFMNQVETIRTFTDHLDMAAVEWILTMREGLRQMQDPTNEIHMLRYEDLVHAPESTLPSLLDFCELERDSKVIEYAQHSLEPVGDHRQFSIHPAIRQMFTQTMDELGY